MVLAKLLNHGALCLSSPADRVRPSPVPERMHLARLVPVSSVLAAVSCASSLLLLWAGLDSNNPKGVFAGLGIPALEYGKIVTMMFLQISISDFLTFFSARAQGGVVWSLPPGGWLLGAATVSLSTSTCLASFWPRGQLGGLPVAGLALGEYKVMPGWIWIYCLLCWCIQDAAKVAAIRILSSTPRLQPFQVVRAKYERQHELLQRAYANPPAEHAFD
jgi:H+-transporting ATPase